MGKGAYGSIFLFYFIHRNPQVVRAARARAVGSDVVTRTPLGVSALDRLVPLGARPGAKTPPLPSLKTPSPLPFSLGSARSFAP